MTVGTEAAPAFAVGRGWGGGEDLPLLGDVRGRLLEGTGEADLFGERARFIGGVISVLFV